MSFSYGFVRTNVSVEADVEKLVAATIERFGELDCAFNNAGVVPFIGHQCRRLLRSALPFADLAGRGTSSRRQACGRRACR